MKTSAWPSGRLAAAGALASILALRRAPSPAAGAVGVVDIDGTIDDDGEG